MEKVKEQRIEYSVQTSKLIHGMIQEYNDFYKGTLSGGPVL